MGRGLRFFTFSAATWRAHVGSSDAVVAAQLHAATTDRSFDAVIDAVIAGVPCAGDETLAHRWVARALVAAGQTPEPAPALDRYWYWLSQHALTRFELGDSRLVSGTARRVIRYLKEGRPLVGDRFDFGFSGGSRLTDVYGWFDEDTVPAFLALIANGDWQEEAAIQRRYLGQWRDQVTQAAAWAQLVAQTGRDVFFTSE